MRDENSSTDNRLADGKSERPGSRASDVGASAVLGGAAAGAVAGTLAGPIGAGVGAAVGALAAGFAGNAIAESVDRSVGEGHWRQSFRQRPYVAENACFTDHGPAYSHGVDGFIRHAGRSFEAVEPDSSRDWPLARADASLDWERARPASRDAWDHVNDVALRRQPGDL